MDGSEVRASLDAARAVFEEDAEASVPLFEHAATVASVAGDHALEAEAELDLGQALLSVEARRPDSLAHFRRAIQLDPGTPTEAMAWLSIADAFRLSGSAPEAPAAASRGVEVFARLGDSWGECLGHEVMARALLAQGRPESALGHLERAAKLALAVDEPPKVAELVLAHGELLLELQREADAERSLGTAAGMFRLLEDRRGEMRALHRLVVAAGRRDLASAQTHLPRLAELTAAQAAEDGDAELEGASHMIIAKLLGERGRGS